MKRMISVALALVMIFALTATVAAATSSEWDSPVGRDYYAIDVGYDPADGSLGTASGDKSSVKIDATGDDGTVTLTAVIVDGSEFTGWEISGDYEIVSGSLTDPVIVIRPLSDIKAVAKFKSTATPDSSSSKSSSGSNDDKTSPKTGDPLWIVLGLAVLALGAGALAVKKIKE